MYFGVSWVTGKGALVGTAFAEVARDHARNDSCRLVPCDVDP